MAMGDCTVRGSKVATTTAECAASVARSTTHAGRNHSKRNAHFGDFVRMLRWRSTDGTQVLRISAMKTAWSPAWRFADVIPGKLWMGPLKRNTGVLFPAAACQAPDILYCQAPIIL